MARGANTIKAAVSVDAVSSSTQQGVSFTFINVHAVLHHHESALITIEAFTLEASGSIDARSVAAEVGGDPAFIYVCTVPFFSVQCKAILTNTAEAPDAVAARSVVAQAVEDLTFIHIFVEWTTGKNVASVSESSSSWTDGPIFITSRFWALLTVNTPGGSHRTAAQINSVFSRQGSRALILIPLHVALLRADINAVSARAVQD